MQQPEFPNHVSKSKDPPCYEDAVKQTRTLQSAVQVTFRPPRLESAVLPDAQICAGSLQAPTAASQQMDDLFDVLINSGGEEPPAS